MKLISMTEFVLEQIMNKEGKSTLDYRDYAYNKMLNIERYANFLKQPLTLGMFIPCDEDGNVLEEPIFYEPNSENEIGDYDELIYKFNLAKEKVLFKNIEWAKIEYCKIEKKEVFKIRFSDYNPCDGYMNTQFEIDYLVERLAHGYITLTDSAIKQLGL